VRPVVGRDLIIMKTFKDQLHRTIHLESTPKRIVSLVPSQTELLFDLDLQDYIVGITKFCVHPSHLKATKSSVGGTKQVDFKKIKALRPDIILCNKEENASNMIPKLEGIAPVHISDIFTFDDSLDLITAYGELFCCETKALKIKDEIIFNLKDFQKYIANKPVLKVAYFIWRNPWMVAANNTFINHLLEFNKFENIYAHLERYPEIELNELGLQTGLDYVFLSSEPFPFKDKHVIEIKMHLKASKTVFVDGEYFSWYGSRLIKAFQYFKDLRSRL